jgi:hypothetical protein
MMIMMMMMIITTTTTTCAAVYNLTDRADLRLGQIPYILSISTVHRGVRETHVREGAQAQKTSKGLFHIVLMI